MYFFFVYLCLGAVPKKPLPNSGSQRFIPMFQKIIIIFYSMI